MKENAETIDKLYDRVEEKAEETIKSARQRVRGGVRRAEDMLEDLADHVTNNPLSSVLWATAAGIAAGVGLAKIAAPSNQHPFLDRVKDGVEAGEKSWRQIREGWTQVLSGLKCAASDVRNN